MSFRLSKTEWNQLDQLLSKHGFGGYYDLIESIRYPLSMLGVGNTGLDIGDPDTKLNLPEIVQLLSEWSNKLSITKGFQEIAESAASEFALKEEAKP
jgi:hypothetical protein